MYVSVSARIISIIWNLHCSQTFTTQPLPRLSLYHLLLSFHTNRLRENFKNFLRARTSVNAKWKSFTKNIHRKSFQSIESPQRIRIVHVYIVVDTYNMTYRCVSLNEEIYIHISKFQYVCLDAIPTTNLS